MLRSLRGLTRLAVTALVLALTFGGGSAIPTDAPSPVTAPARPTPVTTLADGASAPVAAPTAPVDDRAHGVGSAPRDPAGTAFTDAPAGPAAVPGHPAPPAVDPLRGALDRRGPPRH